MTSINQACSDYLKGRKETRRIMEGLAERYQSLGTVGGRFILSKPTQEERDFLQGLLKKDQSHQENLSISLKAFEKAFQTTRFKGMDLEGLLACYFEKPLVSRKQQQETALAARKRFFAEITQRIQHPLVAQWWQHALSQPSSGTAKWLKGLYHQHPTALKQLLAHLEALLTSCDQNPQGVVLPVVAAAITKDPHALDPGTPLRRAFLYFLSDRENVPYPQSAEAEALLMEQGNIITDTVNRSVITYGLEAYDDQGAPLGWHAFQLRREPLTLSRQNLVSALRLTAPHQRVFCAENPAVFHAWVQAHPQTAALCTNGQVNWVVYHLLDKLSTSQVTLFYSGDFDPEGLLIAQRLVHRYPTLQLVGYTPENYHLAKSDKVISRQRLKQLSQLSHPQLKTIGQLLLAHGQAGYQEYLIPSLLKTKFKL